MPGPSVHLRLVRESIAHWEREGTGPVDVADPAVVDALHAGAVAPDAGYYPGAQLFIADLAHYVRTGALTRSLLEEAHSPIETAFAWGWATHVVGDVLIHPAVNRAAAELRDDPGVLTYDDDPAAHVRVEIGLDAFFHARYGTPPLRDALGGEAGFVTRAYERTYGVHIPPADFRTTFAAGLRYQRPMRVLRRLTHAAFPVRGVVRKLAGASLAVGGLFARAAASPPSVQGMFRGVPPAGSLLAAVETALFEYHVHMDRLVTTGLAALEDYDLDTGIAGADALPHRRAVMTQQQLTKHTRI